MTPKVEALDTIATRSKGSLCMSDAAKVLQGNPTALIDYMAMTKWIFKRPGSKDWVAYQDAIDRGLLEHKLVTWEARGTTRSRQQVMVTPKGLAKLSECYGAFRKIFA